MEVNVCIKRHGKMLRMHVCSIDAFKSCVSSLFFHILFDERTMRFSNISQ